MDEERKGNWPPARIFVNGWVCSIHFLKVPGGKKQGGREMLRIICYLVMLQKCATTVT